MNSHLNQTIGIVIPTYQAAKYLPFCLPPLIESPLQPRILVIDSSSTDDTLKIAHEYGVETLLIPQNEFNHGSTRELGRRHLNTDIIVMMTQDAYAYPSMLEKLITPIKNKEASIAYARQIPHDHAGFFESFPRYFNYPELSQTRSLLDSKKYGTYTFFCSNSCAAYLNSVLDEVGGFQPVLFGEDTQAVARILHKGYKISYVAEAIVKHSHHYSLSQEFRRHFDIGLARSDYRALIALGGKDENRGKAYVMSMLSQLMRRKPICIPYAIVQIFIKWLGYKMGSKSINAPRWFKRAFSSQRYYWK